MARRRASDAVVPVRRQLRRTRWRWNGREVGRAILRLAALAAGLAAVIVVAALRVPPRAFAPVAVAALVLAVVGLAAVARTVRRGWLGARRAALLLDREAGLRGRLATLVELDRPEPTSPLLALLIEQNRERLTLWAPRRTVPRLVPRGALAAALAAVAALTLALRLGPRLQPPYPEVVVGNEPVALEPVTGLEDLPTRLLVAPVRSMPPTGRTRGKGSQREGGLGVPGSGEDEASASALDRLQEGIRNRLLGSARPRLHVAGGTSTSADGSSPQRDREGDAEKEDASSGAGWEPIERFAAGAPPRAGEGERRAAAPPPRHLLEPSRDGDGGTGAGAGAGTDTDPNLLGQPTATGTDDSEGFALELGAEVRARRGVAPAAANGAPPAALDAHPQLARRQRAEAPVARMPLPPAYEPLVERLFAHGPR